MRPYKHPKRVPPKAVVVWLLLQGGLLFSATIGTLYLTAKIPGPYGFLITLPVAFLAILLTRWTVARYAITSALAAKLMIVFSLVALLYLTHWANYFLFAINQYVPLKNPSVYEYHRALDAMDLTSSNAAIRAEVAKLSDEQVKALESGDQEAFNQAYAPDDAPSLRMGDNPELFRPLLWPLQSPVTYLDMRRDYGFERPQGVYLAKFDDHNSEEIWLWLAWSGEALALVLFGMIGATMINTSRPYAARSRCWYELDVLATLNGIDPENLKRMISEDRIEEDLPSFVATSKGTGCARILGASVSHGGDSPLLRFQEVPTASPKSRATPIDLSPWLMVDRSFYEEARTFHKERATSGPQDVEL